MTKKVTKLSKDFLNALRESQSINLENEAFKLVAKRLVKINQSILDDLDFEEQKLLINSAKLDESGKIVRDEKGQVMLTDVQDTLIDYLTAHRLLMATTKEFDTVNVSKEEFDSFKLSGTSLEDFITVTYLSAE